MNCSDSVQQCRDWIVNHALPLWASKGFDSLRGGFHESLTADGKPQLSANKRIRAQARQIYVFAHAQNVGWYDGLKLAVAGMKFIEDKGWRPNGQPGWANILDSSGSVIDQDRDLYTHAFILLALGTLYKATKNKHYLDLVDETLLFMDENLRADNGGYFESSGKNLPRRQNPHMHLFEAFQALFDATGDAKYEKRAGEIYRLFQNTFFDQKLGFLREFFTEEWTPHATGEKDIWEPGHHCEWIWLLDQYNKQTNTPENGYASPLFSRVMEAGIIAETGLLHAQLGSDNNIISTPTRVWMQTEYIKACLVGLEGGGFATRSQAEAAIDSLFKYHLLPSFPGGWVDYVSDTGKAINTDMPASTFYHLMCCMTEIERVLGGNDS